MMVFSDLQAISGFNAVSLILAFSGFLLTVRWIRNYGYSLPPGPTPLPILGNILDLKAPSFLDNARMFHRQYGEVFTLELNRKKWIIINSLGALKEAYVTRGDDFGRFPVLTSMNAISGMMDQFEKKVEDQKPRRKAVMQSIRHHLTEDQNTQRVHNVVEAAVENILKESRSNKDNLVNLHDHLGFTILNIMHAFCFGHMLQLESPEFKKLFLVFVKYSGTFGNYWEDLIPALKHWPTQKFRELVHDLKYFQNYIRDKIALRKSRLEVSKTPDNFLDHMILAQKNAEASGDEDAAELLNDDAVYFWVVAMFFAAVDTSRTLLEWVFLILSDKADVRARVCAEVDSTVGNAVPGRQHRQGLVYTECVIQEAMRMFPVAPMGLPHEAVRDTELRGYKIPANTGVFVNFVDILRDPRQWEEPDKFMPERFLEGDHKIRAREAGFVPFSIGSRSCVGEPLARQNLLFAVVGFLQKLTFQLPEGVQADYDDAKLWEMLAPKPYSVVVRQRE